MAASLPYPASTQPMQALARAWRRPVEAMGRGAAIARAGDTPLILINAPLIGSRLGYPELNGLDLLELFAFIHPARFAVPTPKGLADALGLPTPTDDVAAASFLREAAEALLATLEADWPEREGAWASAQALHRLRWPWAAVVAQGLARPERDERWLFSRLPEWEEASARGQPRPIRIATTPALAARRWSREPTARGQRAFAAAETPFFRPFRSRTANPCSRGRTESARRRLSCPRPRLGAERTARYGSRLHQGAATPSDRESARSFPMRNSASGGSCSARAGIISACSTGRRAARRLRGPPLSRQLVRLCRLYARTATWSADLPGWRDLVVSPRRRTALTDRRGDASSGSALPEMLHRTATLAIRSDLVTQHALDGHAARDRDEAWRPRISSTRAHLSPRFDFAALTGRRRFTPDGSVP